MSEAERGERAGHIAAESQEVVAKATKNGMFVLPLTTSIATASLRPARRTLKVAKRPVRVLEGMRANPLSPGR